MDKVFEFWLGRAGSGKTTACIQSIAALANDQPRGTPLLLLVPEQASAQAEYELATQSGLTGYTRARVITFDWLRREVFKQAGGRPKRVLDEQSRVLLLRRLIRQRKEALRVLGDCADLLGLAEAVSQSLTELHRYGWKEEDLEARLAQLKAERAEGGREARETLLEMKLRDLALLWRDYNQSLARREMGDDALLTAMALERIRPWKELDGAQVWIDGFASFTALERALLEALLDHAEGARLALCLDPAEMRSHSAAKFPLIGAERIFGNVEETFRIIRERVSELGWRVKEVELPLPKQATRFSGCPPLAHLETQLTRLRTEAFDAKRWDETRREYSEFPGSPIELVEAQDRRGEVEAAARRIAAMCADGGKTQPGALHGMRWSDATLVTRDLAAYSPFVREIFPQYGIPFFIDERRGIAAHPLARLLASALRIVTQGWRTDSVMAYLKSGLGPIDDRDMIARIESHAAARKLNGGDWLTAAHWSDRDAGRPDGGDTLYAVWEKASGPLRALQDSLARGGSDGPRSLWDFLSSLEAAQKLERWIEEARREGNEETALIHTEAWKEVVDLLDRIHLIAEPGCAADSRAEAAELLEIVETGLATTRAGLIPPALDQVLIGQVDRTRTPRVRAAFVLGLTDGEFPRFYQEDPVFSDQERAKLAAGGREIGPDSKRRQDHERFLSYVALTRSSDYLFLSRPLGGRSEQASGASSLFRAVQESFPMIGVRPDTFEADKLSGIERPEDIARKIARAYHETRRDESTQTLDRILAMAGPFAEICSTRGFNRRGVARAEKTLAALYTPPPAALTSEIAKDFWKSDSVISATALEDYGKCPYKFFSQRMLRLESPAPPLPGPGELGSLRHHILEQLFIRLRDGNALRWEGVDLARADRVIEESAAEALGGALKNEFGRDPLVRAMANLVAGEMKHFVRTMRKMGERYGFEQVHAEFDFGPESRHAGANYRIVADGGLSLTLRGKIDRIDRLAHVSTPQTLILFDYKSSRKPINIPRLEAGIDLQLPAYAIAIEDSFGRGKARVSGFFYWPLNIGVAEAEGEGEDWADPGSEEWFHEHKIEGIFDCAIADHLDHRAGGGESALAFKFKWTKEKKSLHAGVGSWLDSGSFRLVINRVRNLIAARAGEIVSGRISIEPFRQGSERACDLCDFQALCRVKSLGPDAFCDLPAKRFTHYRKELAEEAKLK